MSTLEYRKTHREELKIKESERYYGNRKRILARLKTKEFRKKRKILRSKYKDYEKNYSLLRRHGITLDDFNQMLKTQDNKCAICGNAFKNRKDTCVDHDHNTGQIRQLLCFNCNIGIGKFKDSIDLVNRALGYLEKWSSIC